MEIKICAYPRSFISANPRETNAAPWFMAHETFLYKNVSKLSPSIQKNNILRKQSFSIKYCGSFMKN
jgi:hypothetical protein